MTVLGDEVRELRTGNGWTLEQIASAAGLSISYVSDIERGRRTCPVHTAIALAHALNSSSAHFVTLVLEEALRGTDLEVVVRKKLRGVP